MIFYQNVSLKDIKAVFDKAKIVKRRKKPNVYDISTSFDIETTSYQQQDEKMAFMYIWQFSLDGLVVYGRTWEQYKEWLNTLKKVGNISSQRLLYIYVHNLSFEFQFIRKLFQWEKVFASDDRKVIYGLTKDGFEYKDSYILSGYSLALVAKNLQKHQVRKLVGYLDYDKIRTPQTALTEKELAYCAYDVIIVVDYIDEQREEYGDITKIPLTNTGRVRRYVRNNVYFNGNLGHRRTGGKYTRYRKIMGTLTLEYDEYRQLKRAFQGGFTHANAHYQGKVVENVASVDFTSSYPTVMVTEKFPSSRAFDPKITSLKDFEYKCKLYNMVFDVEFIGLESKIEYDHYLSKSKCKVSSDCIEDNGRIYSASKVDTTMTEIDYAIMKQCYSWQNIGIKNVRAYYKEYLPKDFIKSIIGLYDKKTRLKGIPEKHVEYMRSKGMLNSCYGMCVTDIVRDEHVYSNDGGWELQNGDGEKQVLQYNKSKNRFLFYPWGVWVTAYARRNLWSGILNAGDDYVYSDTDSIKIRNFEKHKPYIDRYNQLVTVKVNKMTRFYHLNPVKLHPLTNKGVRKPIGVWDYEGTYTKFKTLGAKRYMVEQDGKMSITIAGLSKKSGLDYILNVANQDHDKAFDFFDDEMTIPAEHTGKNTHIYIDDKKTMVVTDFQGHTMEITSPSGIFLTGADFTLSISKEYAQFVKMLMSGNVFNGYDNEVN